MLYKVIPPRFERGTHALEGRCSIQLSYGTSLNCGAKVRFFAKTTNFTFKIFFICNKVADLLCGVCVCIAEIQHFILCKVMGVNIKTNRIKVLKVLNGKE